jgi:polyhydroxyalkanoate synthesis regulator phasin
VPPQYAKAERQLVDQHGVVIKVVPRERTPAEQAEFLHQQELDRQAQAAARQQVAYDDFLRQAYSSVADIEKTRDERLSIIDGRLQLAEKSQTSTVATLDELNHRVAVLQAAKQPTPDDLAKSVRSFQAARTSNDEAIAKLRQTRVQTADQFGRDIARYRSLRGLPPS